MDTDAEMDQSTSLSTPEEEELLQCALLREQEWQVLESIYPDSTSRSETPSSTATVDVEVKLELPVEMKSQVVRVVNKDSVSIDEDPQDLILSHLPPLLLTLLLPADYPIKSRPSIVSLHSPHSWLSLATVDMLQKHLQKIWNEPDVVEEGVLWHTCEWLRNAEFLTDLALIEGDVLKLSHPEPHVLIPHLVAYNAASLDTTFSQSTFTCQVCQESLKGSRCIPLACTHVFCRLCLQGFWRLCISEGDVNRVGCPDPQCVKDKKVASEEELRKVLNEEDAIKRWRWLLEKKAIEKDPTIILCPVSVCQTPIPGPEIIDGDESGWIRLRSCPNCGFHFCSYCKRVWHGPISACPAPATTALILEYLTLQDGSSEKLAIEAQIGKKNITKMVACYQEEQQNKAWINACTMACPKCEVHVEKSMGCNHMTCTRCSTHFCYRCGEQIAAENPYIHFSTKGQPCYNMLFDFSTGDVELGDAEWESDSDPDMQPDPFD